MICKEELFKLFEDKTRFINKLPIEQEEKDYFLNFFKSHSTLESKIDWNEKNTAVLISSIRALVMNTNQKAAEKEEKKKGYRGDIDWEAHDLQYLGKRGDYDYALVLSYRGAVFCDSAECGGAGAKWCIGYEQSDRFWKSYISKNIFVLKINFDKLGHPFLLKYMLQLTQVGATPVMFTWNQADRDITEIENPKSGPEVDFIMDSLKKLGYKSFSHIIKTVKENDPNIKAVAQANVNEVIRNSNINDIINNYINLYYPANTVEVIRKPILDIAEQVNIRVNNANFLHFSKFKKKENISSATALMHKKIVVSYFKKYVTYIELGEQSTSTRTFTSFSLFKSYKNLRKVNLNNVFLGRTIQYMFKGCNKLSEVENADFSNIDNAVEAFASTSITSIDMSGFKKLTDAKNMFINCKKLVEVRNVNTPNLSFANGIFCNTGLESIRLGKANASMTRDMFKGCVNLKEVTGLRDFFEERITYGTLESMFEGCVNLRSLDDFTFLGKLYEINNIFLQCYSLEALDVSSIKLPSNNTVPEIFGPEQEAKQHSYKLTTFIGNKQSPELNKYIQRVTEATPLLFK